MKSKNMRRGFNEIPMGHGGGARGESGDVLGPSGNHAKMPFPWSPFHMLEGMRERELESMCGRFEKEERDMSIKASRPGWSHAGSTVADRPQCPGGPSAGSLFSSFLSFFILH